jgi:hypothetical protein
MVFQRIVLANNHYVLPPLMHISSTLGSKKCLGAASEVPSSGFPMHLQEETILIFIYPTSCQTPPALGNEKNQETALTAREAVIRSWLQKMKSCY